MVHLNCTGEGCSGLKRKPKPLSRSPRHWCVCHHHPHSTSEPHLVRTKCFTWTPLLKPPSRPESLPDQSDPSLPIKTASQWDYLPQITATHLQHTQHQSSPPAAVSGRSCLQLSLGNLWARCSALSRFPSRPLASHPLLSPPLILSHNSVFYMEFPSPLATTPQPPKHMCFLLSPKISPWTLSVLSGR